MMDRFLLIPRKIKQSGLGLIELMIAIVIGLIVTAGVLQIFVSTLVGSRDLLEQARLETELTSIMHFMTNDIRRAGYWGDEGKVSEWGSADRNPFITAITGVEGIATGNKALETADSCVLYTYNLDNDGVDDSDSNDARIGYCSSCATPTVAPFSDTNIYDYDEMEMFGYRLDTDPDGNKFISMRTGAVATDAVFSCDAGTWGPLSDSEVISITGLSFDLDANAIATVTADDGSVLTIESVEVEIEMTGVLVSDSALQKTITTTVRLANTRVSD